MLRRASCLVLPVVVLSINNGLGRVPVLGWSTWCTDGSCGRDVCTELEIHEVAQALIDSGLQAAGWTMVALDDCWEMDSRDAQGRLLADATRFPSGMRALTDWLHGKGFQAGTYTSLGYFTCNPSGHPNKLPGSYPSFNLDAHTIVVDWGFDYLKGDWCDWETPIPLDIGNTTTWMAASLNATGVPNMFTFHGIAGIPWTTASGNYARILSDHHDEWSSTSSIIGQSALLQSGAFAGPQAPDLGGGYWYPDLDFLMTGGQGCDAFPNASVHCPGQTDIEYKTEFSFWALSNSVLLFATDPRNLTHVMNETLFNAELLKVNQHGGQGVVLQNLLPCAGADGHALTQPCQLWHRQLSPPFANFHYVIVYNPNTSPDDAVNVAFNFTQAAIPPYPATASVAVRDLWLHEDMGAYKANYTVPSLPGHGVVALQLVAQS